MILTGIGLVVLTLTLSTLAEAGGDGDWTNFKEEADWIVGQDTHVDNETNIIVRNSIIIRNNSLLRLDNVTLTFHSSVVDKAGLSVTSGSRLELQNTILRSTGAGGYYLNVATDVQGFWQGVDASGVRSELDRSDGFVVHGSGFSIRDSIIHDTTYGLITAGDLELEGNTFYNTTVAIRSVGPLGLEGVANNTFEWQGHNQTLARFMHFQEVDLEVLDQDDLPVEGATITGRDELGIPRFSSLTDSDGKLLGGLFPDAVLELDGQTTHLRNYSLVVSYLTASTNGTLDLMLQDSLGFDLTLLPDVTVRSLFVPAPRPDTFIYTGAQNNTAISWDDEDPNDEAWKGSDWDPPDWQAGALPLGEDAYHEVSPNTYWVGGVAYLRIPFFIPRGTLIHQGLLSWTAITPNSNDRLNVYLNGAYNIVTWQGSNDQWEASRSVDGDYFREGRNILALRYQAFTDPYLDLKLELVVAHEAFEPLVANGSYQLLAVMANQGARDALTKVELLVDGQVELSQTRALAAASTWTRIYNLAGLAAGSHNYTLRLDPDGGLEELDHDNNNLTVNATAYEVGFRVDTGPDPLSLHTYETGRTSLQVTNTGEVTDRPLIELEEDFRDWTLELVTQPPEMSPGAQTSLSFSLDPPDSEPAGTQQVGLRVVSGLAPLSGSAWAAFTVEVEVLESYDLKLTSTVQRVETLLGSPRKLDLSLFNLGNAQDDYDLEIVQRAELEAQGWELVLPDHLSGVAGGGSRGFSLTLNLTVSTERPHHLTLRAVSRANASHQARLELELVNLAYTYLEPLPAYTREALVPLNWTFHDPTFLFDELQLFYRTRTLFGDWGPWTRHGEPLKVKPYYFELTNGYVFEFYTSATLKTGGREPKFQAEANTTVDLEAPRSQVLFHTPWEAGSKLTVQTHISLSWAPYIFPVGTPSDIIGYDLEVKIDDRPYQLVLARTTNTSAELELEPGHAYTLRVRAWDQAGWQEQTSSGQNRIGFRILERPFWARLEGGESFTLNSSVNAYLVLEPGARASAVQLQYLDVHGEWVTFQRVVAPEGQLSLPSNGSLELGLPLEGLNYLRAVVENGTGAIVDPGPWQLTSNANGLSGFTVPLQRRPFYEELEVTVDPAFNGSFNQTLTEELGSLGYELDRERNQVIFGNGANGYKPQRNEAVRVTYPAYDLLVERNSEPPVVPHWTRFELDELTGALQMELKVTQLEPGTVFWFERSNVSDGGWNRMHLDNLTLGNDGDALTFTDRLTEGQVFYYRVGAADPYGHVAHSPVKLANLTVATSLPSDREDGTPSFYLILLLTAVGLAIMGAVVAKFNWDRHNERREVEADRTPERMVDLPEVFDGSLEGFAIMSGNAEEGYSIVCRSCGTQRGVTPAQASEEVTCPGCGQLQVLEPEGAGSETEEPPDETPDEAPGEAATATNEAVDALPEYPPGAEFDRPDTGGAGEQGDEASVSDEPTTGEPSESPPVEASPAAWPPDDEASLVVDPKGSRAAEEMERSEPEPEPETRLTGEPEEAEGSAPEAEKERVVKPEKWSPGEPERNAEPDEQD